MRLTTLDIIMFSLGAIIVFIYAFIKIRKYNKQKKFFNECLKKGYTKEYAKELTYKEFNKSKKLEPTDKENNE